jgi:anti-sigma factor ChrR (cupin superfamily)
MAAKEVILYFEDPSDALRFTLAAGSVMAGDRLADGMTREMRRATRITLGNAEEAEQSHLAADRPS